MFSDTMNAKAAQFEGDCHKPETQILTEITIDLMVKINVADVNKLLQKISDIMLRNILNDPYK